MFERFTEKSIKVINYAQEEAQSLNNPEVLPEHLLLGILREETGISARFLKVSGVNYEVLRDRLSSTLNKNQIQPKGNLPFSKNFKKVLKSAWDKAVLMDVYYISPSHIFLALLQEQESIVNQLKDLDVQIDRITDSVKRVVEKRAKTLIHPESPIAQSGKKAEHSTYSIFEEENVKDIMNMATQELKKTPHENLGTEQILISILKDEASEISSLLSSKGVTVEKVKADIEELTSRKAEYDYEQASFTPKALNAVNSAYDIAKELGSANVLPDHLLLGLLKEKSGIAFDILKKNNINTEKLFTTLLHPIEKQKPETFTIIKLAREEARRLGHNTVGTELILLGIILENSSMASNVLKSLDLTIKDVRNEVEKIIGYGNEYEEKEISLTPRVKKLLQIALEKAKKYNKQRIEAIHLLLGITKLSDCVAMKVLENLGVDVLEIRNGILKELDVEK